MTMRITHTVDSIKFHNILGDTLSLDDVVREILEFVKTAPRRRYRIIVGTDSAIHRKVRFVTAITTWRVGNGGVYFWSTHEQNVSGDLRERIYQETMRSITLAQELRGQLKDALGDEFFWDDQIHIDVGEHGPTKDMIDAVVGMVKGYGFDPVIKPYAFGASSVADRHT